MAGLLSWLFGRSAPSGNERLLVAEKYLATGSGLIRHYHASAIRQTVYQFTGVLLTLEETVECTERVRSRRGWGRRPYESYFPPLDPSQRGSCYHER